MLPGLWSNRCLLVMLLSWGVLAAVLSPAAAEKGKVAVQKIEYQGWKNNLKLTNGEVELVLTLDVGPRVIRYNFVGGENVFKEYKEQLGKTGENTWQIRGGHRLWVAPEDPKRTYVPDNRPVMWQQIEAGTIRLIPPPEQPFGIQKEIDVTLAPTGTKVTLVHRVRNVGKEPTELAPWALSVMAPGGVEIIPLPPKRPHPGGPENAKSPADFAPNQSLAMWPFFDFKDPRYSFGSKYILLRQDAQRGPTKIGLAHRMGWVGYLNRGTLFLKRFGYQEGKTYPDYGSNFETFTNEDMLEVETLGPLSKLAPNMAVEHTEEWELHKDVPPVTDEASIEKTIASKVGR